MWKMLKHIGKTHRKRLIATFSLVRLENLLMLIYPVFGGWAINAVIEGNVWQAMLYGLVVLLMWLVGAARRVTLLREFVSFFEEHLPIAATSLVSIFGACIMLLGLEFWVGVLAVGILALFLWLLPRFATISENLYFRLNNCLERDNHFIQKGNERQLYQHYGLVARLRVLISNREASGYLCIGVAMSILFGFALVHMTLKGFGNAGHIYSVSTYLWMFAMSLDDVPRLVEQYSNLKDIGQRVELSEKGLA